MKRDEFNNYNIQNADGHIDVQEDSLKNIKETIQVSEVEKEEETFTSSETNNVQEGKEEQSFESTSSETPSSNNSINTSTATTSGATGAIGAVGGVVGAVAASTLIVIGVINLPAIPTVTVELLTRSSSTLAFSINTNIEDQSTLTVSLKGVDYEISTPFQEYIKFYDLRENEVYTLSVYENDTSRYSSNFFTNDVEEVNNIFIEVTSYIDDKLCFYFVDEDQREKRGEKLYTVTVKDKSGKILLADDTNTPKEYEMNNFTTDVAIYVAVNGVITAGVQVYKPVYDYEHIEWIWGDEGDTVTAIIPALNETEPYYVRDIRNFEIDRKEPTCTEDGYVIKQAAFIGPDKNKYENERKFPLPSEGHDFSNMTYSWSNDYHVCHAEATCSVCQTKISESVNVNIEEIVTEKGLSFARYTASFQNEHFETKYHYENVVFGSYPQTLEKDESVISRLDEEYGNPEDWLTYQYYASGDNMPFMYYKDVDTDYDGEFDYRGVYFNEYRPINTTDEIGSTSYQYDNGYEKDTFYWFKYEPIRWSVLDADDGKLFITTEMILDSQSFYHESAEAPFIHNNGEGYANNYELSDIRLWLNNEFLSYAFLEESNDVISTTVVDNSLASTLDSANEYICNDTEDKLFLLSRAETNQYLSIDASAIGTDYAKCQGLYVASEDNNSFYSLRSPYPNQPYQTRYITNEGKVAYDSITKTSLGVRPACWINIDL